MADLSRDAAHDRSADGHRRTVIERVERALASSGAHRVVEHRVGSLLFAELGELSLAASSRLVPRIVVPIRVSPPAHPQVGRLTRHLAPGGPEPKKGSFDAAVDLDVALDGERVIQRHLGLLGEMGSGAVALAYVGEAVPHPAGNGPHVHG